MGQCFSLGITFFEMFCAFYGQPINLNDFRAVSFYPKYRQQVFPKAHNQPLLTSGALSARTLVKQLITENPMKRPNAERIMEQLFSSEDNEHLCPLPDLDIPSDTTSLGRRIVIPQTHQGSFLFDINWCSSFPVLNERFTVGDRLGGGRYGEVIRCRHVCFPAGVYLLRSKFDDKEYAVKILEARPIYKKEVALLKSLKHKNVVRYYDSWKEVCLLHQRRR